MKTNQVFTITLPNGKEFEFDAKATIENGDHGEIYINDIEYDEQSVHDAMLIALHDAEWG